MVFEYSDRTILHVPDHELAGVTLKIISNSRVFHVHRETIERIEQECLRLRGKRR